MRAFALAWIVALGGCTPIASAFRCADSAACVREGVAGTCEGNHWCSFPDAACGSGRRYGEFAGDGLSNSCVPQPIRAGRSARPAARGRARARRGWSARGDVRRLRRAACGRRGARLRPVARRRHGRVLGQKRSRPAGRARWRRGGGSGRGRRSRAAHYGHHGDRGRRQSCVRAQERQDRVVLGRRRGGAGAGGADDDRGGRGRRAACVRGARRARRLVLGRERRGAARHGAVGGIAVAGRVVDGAGAPLAAASLAAGATHSCAVGRDHKLVCWGSDVDGELGDGTTAATRGPTPAASLRARDGGGGRRALRLRARRRGQRVVLRGRRFSARRASRRARRWQHRRRSPSIWRRRSRPAARWRARGARGVRWSAGAAGRRRRRCAATSARSPSAAATRAARAKTESTAPSSAIRTWPATKSPTSARFRLASRELGITLQGAPRKKGAQNRRHRHRITTTITITITITITVAVGTECVRDTISSCDPPRAAPRSRRPRAKRCPKHAADELQVSQPRRAGAGAPAAGRPGVRAASTCEAPAAEGALSRARHLAHARGVWNLRTRRCFTALATRLLGRRESLRLQARALLGAGQPRAPARRGPATSRRCRRA